MGRTFGKTRRTVSMLWLRTSGPALTTAASASRSPEKSGIRTSTLHVGASPADLVDGEREHTCAAVRQVIAVYRGNDCVAQAHVCHGAGKPERFGCVERAGPAGLHVAVRARPRARVPQDHERGGAALPAIADVRAGRLFAHGVQFGVPETPSEIEVIVTAGSGYFEPLGEASLHCQRRLDPTIRAGNSLSRSDAPGPCTAEYQMTALRREFWRCRDDVRPDSPSPRSPIGVGDDGYWVSGTTGFDCRGRRKLVVGMTDGGWRRQRRTISGTTVYPSGSRDVVQRFLVWLRDGTGGGTPARR